MAKSPSRSMRPRCGTALEFFGCGLVLVFSFGGLRRTARGQERGEHKQGERTLDKHACSLSDLTVWRHAGIGARQAGKRRAGAMIGTKGGVALQPRIDKHTLGIEHVQIGERACGVSFPRPLQRLTGGRQEARIDSFNFSGGYADLRCSRCRLALDIAPERPSLKPRFRPFSLRAFYAAAVVVPKCQRDRDPDD